jgi:hypothetical protein
MYLAIVNYYRDTFTEVILDRKMIVKVFEYANSVS